MKPFLILICTLLSTSLFAADLPLPYSVRHRAYSGYSTTVRGDNENIGMSDATVAIPGSISSLESNPAGLTMTMGSVSAQINSNEMQDRELTGTDRKKVRASQWGLAVTPNDWGYAISSYTPTFEGANYSSMNTGVSNEYEVSMKQLRGSVSHSMLNKRLSLGAALQLNRATRRLGGATDNANGLALQFGAIYRLDHHFLIGASYSPPSEIGDYDPNSGGTELPGFTQPIRSPMLLTLGAGWIPNRFFSAGFSMVGVGKTHDTALLIDDSRLVGEHFTVQPRIGASYMIGQYSWVKISTAVGSYYETSRTEGIGNRLHGTFAFQVNPYFLNIGVGIDRAERYNNFIFSIGVDLVRTLRTFKIIPKDPVPPLHGFWPNPLLVQADGLPDALTEGEKKEFSGPSAQDVTNIIQNIPQNIDNAFKGEAPVEETPKGKAEVKKKTRRHKKGNAPPSETSQKG